MPGATEQPLVKSVCWIGCVIANRLPTNSHCLLVSVTVTIAFWVMSSVHALVDPEPLSHARPAAGDTVMVCVDVAVALVASVTVNVMVKGVTAVTVYVCVGLRSADVLLAPDDGFAEVPARGKRPARARARVGERAHVRVARGGKGCRQRGGGAHGHRIGLAGRLTPGIGDGELDLIGAGRREGVGRVLIGRRLASPEVGSPKSQAHDEIPWSSVLASVKLQAAPAVQLGG